MEEATVLLNLLTLSRIQEEYINLLGEECSEYAIVMVARNPDWESSRWKEGIEFRKRIEEVKQKLKWQ